METYLVINIDKNKLTLLNTYNGKEVTHLFTFYDLPRPLKSGDKIAFHSEILDKKYKEYNAHYFFGPTEQEYGRDIQNEQNFDFLALKLDNEKVFLKRFYG